MSRRVGKDERVPLGALVPAGLATDVLARPEPTLAECIAPFLGWFGAIRGRRPNTLLGYAKDLRLFVAFAEAHGVRHPHQVTFNVVEAFMAVRHHREGKKATTVNRARNAIDQLFRFLRRQGVVTHNPVEDVFALKESKRLPNYLSILDQERILEHFAASQSLEGRRNYAMIATALWTGLRVEELATLRCDAVDLEGGKLRVVGKGDKERECEVTPRLRAILTDYLRDVRPKLMARPVTGYLYHSSSSSRRGDRRYRSRYWHCAFEIDGRRVERSTGTADEAEARAVLADMVRDLTKAQESPYLFPRAGSHGAWFRAKAGQPLLTRSIHAMISRKVSAIAGRDVHPHMLRHSFASRLRENGAPLELIQEALGHANIATTLIYAHISTRKKREDITRYLEGSPPAGEGRP